MRIMRHRQRWTKNGIRFEHLFGIRKGIMSDDYLARDRHYLFVLSDE